MQVKTVQITADGSGSFTTTRPFVGVILAVKVTAGTLGTFDITVSDGEIAERDLLILSGVDADVLVQPVVAGQSTANAPETTVGDIAWVSPAVVGSIEVTVSSADPDGVGSVRFVLA